MDEVFDKLIGLGVGGLILIYVVGTTGLAGFTAFTAALALLGGPWGMWGGVLTLGLASMISALIAKKGLDAVAIAYVKRLVKQGENKKELLEELNSMPWKILCSKSLRARIKVDLEKMNI